MSGSRREDARGTNPRATPVPSRRAFLATLGASLGAVALWRRPGAAAITDAGAERIAQVGLQLYTVRRAMQEDLEGTIAKVAAIGYKQVEFAGYFGKSAKEIRAILDRNGLTSPSAHSADVNTIRNHWAQALDDAAVIGQQYLVCASLPQSEQTADGYKRMAALFNEAGDTAAKSGLHLGYHNHNSEFKPLGDTNGYEILLNATDPKLVAMEMDLYWVNDAKQDPLTWFARYPGRFFAVHVKDMAPDGSMADVGSGTLPWAKYFAQSKEAGIRYYIVEHDHPADPFASITNSYRYLAALEF